MAKIKPFMAVTYNLDKFKDLSKLVCPPYDVISPTQQDYYHEVDTNNFIHILLRRDSNKYQRAGNLFRSWIADEVLVQDDKPAIYFYVQDYNIKGEKKTRLGFIALLRLGDKGSPVFAHENTRREATDDRFKLIKVVNANLSPIFVVSRYKKRVIQRVYDRYLKGVKPMIAVKDNENTLNKLWRINSTEVLDLVQSSMQNEDVFIADGHHRYQVSCTYRDEIKQKLGDNFSEDSSFNYTLSYFTNTDNRGLLILPIHRLLKLDKPIDLNKFLLKLKDYFDVEEVKDKTRFFFLMEKGGRTEHVLGMYKDKKYWLLRLKNVKILDKLIIDKPKEYRSLDVSILNYLILKNVLNLDLEKQDYLKYSPHADEFIQATDNNPLNIVFFLNPVKIEQIIDVALGGNKMPPKSTYFYPKVLSGLVINKHEEL